LVEKTQDAASERGMCIPIYLLGTHIKYFSEFIFMLFCKFSGTSDGIF
jgi:hypothetical protein